MSDKCIRDYLNQMDAIFGQANLSVPQFCKSLIDTDTQDSALHAASIRKKDAIPRSEVGSPLETLRLIDALGQLTNRIQTTTAREKSLRSSELGLFLVDVSRKSPETLEALRLLKEASEAGFLKIRKLTDKVLQFRVHCSLAPSFGFLWRS